MDLNRNTFLLFKTIMAGSALLLQIVAIKYLGSEVTGTINQYQLIAMSLSILIFPGLEMSLIRFLPIEKEHSNKSYKHHMKSLVAIARLTYLSSIALVVVFFALELFSITSAANEIIIVSSLMLFLFNARIVPLLFRIERNMVGSILSEPGIISAFTIIVILSITLLSTNITISPSIILFLPIFFSALISIILLKSLKEEPSPKSFIINKDTLREWHTLIKKKYSLTFVYISASNFSILWGLAALGSILLPPEEVAIYVTILRVFSILLFVEGAVVAYYLPTLVKDFSTGMKAKEFDSYRNYMTAGTILVGSGLSLVIYILDIFQPLSFEFFSVILLTTLQILITSFGSPFAIAAATIKEKKIREMSFILLLLAMVSAVILMIFLDWRIIIVSFAVLQFIRFILGYRSISSLLNNHRKKKFK